MVLWDREDGGLIGKHCENMIIHDQSAVDSVAAW